MDPISAFLAAANFVFNSAHWAAQVIRFVGSTLITTALSETKVPRLADLKIQASSYGAAIPRVYGECVRIAGNVIDKSDLVPVKHTKGDIAGIGGVKYFTYYADLVILLCEGPIAVGGLKRILADGKVIFDRDDPDATPGTTDYNGVTGCLGYPQSTGTHALGGGSVVRFYRGTATQGVDDVVQALHPGEDVPAYRNSAYVVLEKFSTEPYGGRVPNLEFEIEPAENKLGKIVEDIASFADVTVYANRLDDITVRGYAVANDGSCWDAIQPLASVYFFDMFMRGTRFEAQRRGRYLRTRIPQSKLAAGPRAKEARNTRDVEGQDPNNLPDEVTISYFDIDRNRETNTQRARRNAGFSRNKINAEAPLVLTADEAKGIAQMTLNTMLAASKRITWSIAEEYRWLQSGDVIGLPVANNDEPFRILDMKRSPNGVIACEGTYEDPLAYINNLTGATGLYPDNPLSVPGETIMQPVDGPIIRNADDDTGFYAAFLGTGPAWRGAAVWRALGTGSPLTYTEIGNIGLAAPIGDCNTTLADGVTEYVDAVNSLTVTMLGSLEPETITEDEMIQQGLNLAWVGDPDTGAGEFINFASAVETSPPGTFVLSTLLRGRLGTEHMTGAHGANERFVMFNDRDQIYRLDFGAIDWNLARTYKAVSLFLDVENVTGQAFTNTGEGKKPLSPVHLEGTRDGSNNLTITWDRRTRYQTPALGGGATPLGEEFEAYEIDIYAGSPGAVVNTLTATSPTVTYTAAEQTADGLTPGDPVLCEVFQMSSIYGRGRGKQGTV